MIIFLNGAFGVGKTTVAERLSACIPESLLYNAEEVGFFLRRVLMSIDREDDFQHYPIWRTLTIETARLLQRFYNRTLIMPMAIWYQPYFDEIIGGLAEFESQLFVFCLTATEQTLHERLRERNDRPEAFIWCIKQAVRCLAAFKSPTFGKQIVTDGKSSEEVVSEILSFLPLIPQL